jgi:hypothetical protein
MIERPKSREETPKMGDSVAAPAARAARAHMILFVARCKKLRFISNNYQWKVVLRPQSSLRAV